MLSAMEIFKLLLLATLPGVGVAVAVAFLLRWVARRID